MREYLIEPYLQLLNLEAYRILTKQSGWQRDTQILIGNEGAKTYEGMIILPQSLKLHVKNNPQYAGEVAYLYLLYHEISHNIFGSFDQRKETEKETKFPVLAKHAMNVSEDMRVDEKFRTTQSPQRVSAFTTGIDVMEYDYLITKIIGTEQLKGPESIVSYVLKTLGLQLAIGHAGARKIRESTSYERIVKYIRRELDESAILSQEHTLIENPLEWHEQFAQRNKTVLHQDSDVKTACAIGLEMYNDVEPLLQNITPQQMQQMLGNLKHLIPRSSKSYSQREGKSQMESTPSQTITIKRDEPDNNWDEKKWRGPKVDLSDRLRVLDRSNAGTTASLDESLMEARLRVDLRNKEYDPKIIDRIIATVKGF